jgi:hypothetical protein
MFIFATALILQVDDNQVIECLFLFKTLSIKYFYYLNQYIFFHPGHLGSGILLTDANGDPYQFVVNLPYAKKLAESLGQLQQVAMHPAGLGMKQSSEIVLADATLYLEYFGTVVIAWMWLLQGEQAAAALPQASGSEVAFYESKLATMKYSTEYELPKTLGLHARLVNDDKLTA